MTLKKLAGALMAAGLGVAAFGAHAQVSGDKVKIGYITDLSGLYADIDGQGGVEAVKMAIEDAGGKVLGKPIELVTADHQNKADIAASKAREWMDQQGIDMLLGGTNSATSLAMSKVAAEKKKVFIGIGAGTARLTNEECTPYTIHYAYDTVALAKGTGSAVVKQGGKSWFFLTADYAFGHSLENDTAAVVKANLQTTLSGAGPFTVFAPTHDAFAAISSTVNSLTTQQLTNVLTYHVLGSQVLSANIPFGTPVTTVLGQSLVINTGTPPTIFGGRRIASSCLSMSSCTSRSGNVSRRDLRLMTMPIAPSLEWAHK